MHKHIYKHKMTKTTYRVRGRQPLEGGLQRVVRPVPHGVEEEHLFFWGGRGFG